MKVTNNGSQRHINKDYIKRKLTCHKPIYCMSTGLNNYNIMNLPVNMN